MLSYKSTFLVYKRVDIVHNLHASFAGFNRRVEAKGGI
jgi:hypothetical protein